MHLNTTPATNRISSVEMRYLRNALASCEGECWETSLNAIVIFAKLHDNLDLRQEAAALRAERTQKALGNRFTPAA